jgi:hypothetical protein
MLPTIPNWPTAIVYLILIYAITTVVTTAIRTIGVINSKDKNIYTNKNEE